MDRLFGTDGIRGVANTELTPELAFNLGKAAAHVLSKKTDCPVVLIGKDTRVSGDMLEDAISAGILTMGGSVVKAGILPTPAIAYLVRHMKADAGIVISASHNSYEYNGIKIFNSKGFKLDDGIETEIEDIINQKINIGSRISGGRLGRSVKAESDAINTYEKFLKNTVDVRLDGLKVVIDCANGASYMIAEEVLSSLGAFVTVIGNEPNGININDKCGSTSPEGLQKQVVKEKADVGLAFDGDADRLIAVDETGRVLDGDHIIYICAKMFKDEGRLPGNLVTVTVMSNIGFHKAMSDIGCRVEIAQVGDRYVLESMLKTGCVIGGEQSGHIIFLSHSTTGDGILSSLKLLSAMKKSGKKLSELGDQMTVYPQILRNVTVESKNKKIYAKDSEIMAKIESIEKQIHGEGRVLVRPSGTEPLIRIMIEGKDRNYIAEMAEDLANLIAAKLG